MAWGCTGGSATPMAPEDKRIVEEPERGASRKVEERVGASRSADGMLTCQPLKMKKTAAKMQTAAAR